jgi:hypothetical protein
MEDKGTQSELGQLLMTLQGRIDDNREGVSCVGKIAQKIGDVERTPKAEEKGTCKVPETHIEKLKQLLSVLSENNALLSEYVANLNRMV